MIWKRILKKNQVYHLCIGIIFLLSLCCSPDDEQRSEAARFDRFAREVFKDVYPSIAAQIIDDYQITDWLCLDLGCGSGYLSIEVAERSDLQIIGVDIDPEAVRIGCKNIEEVKLDGRITIEEGDVHQLRFADDSADLIISRGSFIFWDDVAKVFSEINRVLKPGGVAFIGGGLGRDLTIEEKQDIQLKINEAGFQDSRKHTFTPVMMQELLESVNIWDYQILADEPYYSGCLCSMWVVIRKSQVSQSI